MTPVEGARKKLGTLLVLSTYPIRKPRHGGQLRSAALMVEYKKAFSKVVRTAIFNSSVYSKNEYGRTDIPSPPEVTQEIVRTPELEAWILGNSASESDLVRRQLQKLIAIHKPDVILFEQPFLYMGMKQVISDLQLEIPIIYSSHNVESEMMKEIFTNQQIESRFQKELSELEECEKALTNKASGIIAVSEDDAAILLSWGGKNLIVQGNGAYPNTASRLKRLRVRRVMKKLGVDSYALYVGSSHRPNIDGFIDLLGTRLGYIPQDSMIFLAGDIARGLHPEVSKIDPIWGDLMWARVFNWDRVSDKTLSALIAEAKCILLPMTSGGGSNLKTAEALLSGKQVVATPTALRGFSKQTVASKTSTPEGFRDQMVANLADKEVDEFVQSSFKPDANWETQLSELSKWILQTKRSM